MANFSPVAMLATAINSRTNAKNLELIMYNQPDIVDRLLILTDPLPISLWFNY